MQNLTLMKNKNYYLCEGYKTKTLNKKLLYFPYQNVVVQQ